MLTFLRQLLRTYAWVEPEPFRRAEQFGLDETERPAPAGFASSDPRRCGRVAAPQVQTNLMTPQAS